MQVAIDLVTTTLFLVLILMIMITTDVDDNKSHIKWSTGTTTQLRR